MTRILNKNSAVEEMIVDDFIEEFQIQEYREELETADYYGMDLLMMAS